MLTLSRGKKRIAIFAAVGAVCFSVQLAVLNAMVQFGADRPVANAIGFAASAQINFLLSSRVTWRDRPTAGLRGISGRWAAYNATALVSLGVNTAVFAICYRIVGTTAAAACGVLVGTCVVFLTCNLLVFRSARAQRGAKEMIPVTADRTAA